MNRITKPGIAAFSLAGIALALGLLIGCNATEPLQRTCTMFGFSNDGKRDSSWQVPCN